ncbi:dynein heavy chain, cytosolic [Strigomonas culicis]|uniref:Dynein heavy chain, cytosolic n=1 Tax=Strigomonas culicis TaxID=28005 RepID=S9V229_9TRYP|nr:dynein heavy chain, cytosolic [Strigomonas culicis]|eukprot:EPY20971.1 dynein heavy chain, cytosolic [Strigomonas culicis]
MSRPKKQSIRQDVPALAQRAASLSREEPPLRLAMNHLVAYEYVGPRGDWQWGLGTVADLSGPRIVRLCVWQASGSSGGAMSPVSGDVVDLLATQNARTAAEAAAEALRKDLSTRHIAFRSGRSRREEELEAAEQTLRDALVEVQMIGEKDWREIRSYPKPPAMVELVLSAVMIVLDEPAKAWQDVLKVIREKNFVRRIEELNPVNITTPNCRRLEPYLQNPRFTYQNAMAGSRAIGALQRWVCAQRSFANLSFATRDYDLTHSAEKDALVELEERLAQVDSETQQLQEEEALQARGGRPSLVLDHGAAAGVRECIHGVDATYRFTDATVAVLRAAVLADLGTPPATTLTLTPEQAAQLTESLKARAAPLAQEQQAEAERRRLQRALDDLRQDYAESLRALEEAQNAREEAPVEAESAPLSHSGASAPDSERMHELEDEIGQMRDQLAALQLERDMDPQERRSSKCKSCGGEDMVVDAGAPPTSGIDLRGIIAALQKESALLTNRSGDAQRTLVELNDRLESHPLLQKVMSAVDE